MQIVLLILLAIIVLQLAHLAYRLGQIHESVWAMFKYWDEQKVLASIPRKEQKVTPVTNALWAIFAALLLVCWLLYWILNRLGHMHQTIVAIFRYGSERVMRSAGQTEENQL